MNKRKKRLAPRDAKRLRTLRQNKTPEQISEDARRAGSLAGTKYDSERGRAAINERWRRYRERKAQEAIEKGE